MQVKSLAQRAFEASLLILATVFILNLALGYLREILPWLVGAAVVILVVWIVVAIVRWRRSRW